MSKIAVLKMSFIIQRFHCTTVLLETFQGENLSEFRCLCLSGKVFSMLVLRLGGQSEVRASNPRKVYLRNHISPPIHESFLSLKICAIQYYFVITIHVHVLTHIKVLHVRVHAMEVWADWTIPAVARQEIDTGLSLLTTDWGTGDRGRF